MKFLIPIFFVFSTLPLLAADEEIEVMQELISATQKSLNGQKELLNALIRFKQVRHAFVEDPTSKRLAKELVKSAVVVQQLIESQYLAHLFASDFLSEIHFFHQVATQPKP